MSIFELINSNIKTVSDDVHELMDVVHELCHKVDNLEHVFVIPEEPNAHGEEGSEEVSSEH